MTLVPYTAGEKPSLVASLQRHREAVLWKLEGLDDEQLRRRVVGSEITLLGTVKHLASVEYGWFCSTFGRPSDEVPSAVLDEDPQADWRIHPWETTEGVLAYYQRARAAADAAIRELKVTERGTAWHGETVTLRWVLLHMVEETARHAGHVDVLRELIDGRTGDHPEPGDTP
ncbi:DinB family protein [Kineococcus aurantiacus]|uniref:Putative damage-inducible protein DinB n=1 Tax=Kineococcus aurantiacus TaxID=37633 RepID=A0A7Y9DNX7_9ACTN|nr:DinB family protein [Kineococcus aurantiacus]NYD24075.1 putative damage-inducible protein DinB [Kineococcus aurantiacus]